jgi:hypothetical protein
MPRVMRASRSCLHHLVDRFPVGDVVLGLEPREHGQHAADRPGDQRPEPDHPEGGPAQDHAGQLEEHGDQEKGGRQVVQRRVQAGPVVTEHRVSSEA